MRLQQRRPLREETINERNILTAKFLAVPLPESSEGEYGYGRFSAEDAKKGMLSTEMEKYLGNNVLNGIITPVYSFSNAAQLAQITAKQNFKAAHPSKSTVVLILLD